MHSSGAAATTSTMWAWRPSTLANGRAFAAPSATQGECSNVKPIAATNSSGVQWFKSASVITLAPYGVPRAPLTSLSNWEGCMCARRGPAKCRVEAARTSSALALPERAARAGRIFMGRAYQCATQLAHSCVMMSSMKRIERVRLYPTPSQRRRLGFMLDVTRDFFNACLQQRRDAWRLRRHSASTKEQYHELTALRAEDARVAAVYRELEDAVLHRLDLAFAAFFRRIRKGETPGYPRFRSRSRWDQLEFPHGDRALKFNAGQSKVKVPGVGFVALRRGRRVPEFGRAWLVRKGEHWYTSFECERKVTPLPSTGKAIGIDRGVHVLAATSEGKLIGNPRFLEKARLLIERLQRAVAGRKRGGKNRRKAVRLLARAHERVKEARRDFMHKTARKIVNGADVVVLEALNLRAMTRSAKGTIEKPGRKVAAKAGLNRAILDASFGLLRQMIVAKAEEAARTVVEVDARYSSQECAHCGQVAAESRRGRRYACIGCGFKVHADVNAALVIRRRAELRPAARGASLEDLGDPRSVPDAGAEPARCDQEVAA